MLHQIPAICRLRRELRITLVHASALVPAHALVRLAATHLLHVAG